MLLEHKVAVIYGAGGSIGGAVARAFAREGANVFLAGRTKANINTLAEAIRSYGGTAEAAVVDALDQRAVDAYVDKVADVGNVAAFVASDQARTITSSAVNISCGALVD